MQTMKTFFCWLLLFAAGFVLSKSLRSSIEEMLPVCVFSCFGKWFAITIQCIAALFAALVVKTAMWVVRQPKRFLFFVLLLLPLLVVLAMVSAMGLVFFDAIVSPWFGKVIIPVADYLVSEHLPRATVALIMMAMMAPIFLFLWFPKRFGDLPPMIKLGQILDRVIEYLWELYDEHILQRVLDRDTATR
jgi:hypothetical protein